MGNLFKRVELLANVSIITLSLLVAVIVVKRFVFPNTLSTAPFAPIQRGTKLSLAGVDWAKSNQSLLLVLSDDCRYCTESAEFYRRLIQERTKQNGPPLIAVLPQEVSKGQAYLNKLGVTVDEVKQASLSTVGVRGTPTLILVDSTGAVKDSWVGKLPPDKEAEVLNRLLVERASK
jgi:peroxiredoxin